MLFLITIIVAFYTAADIFINFDDNTCDTCIILVATPDINLDIIFNIASLFMLQQLSALLLISFNATPVTNTNITFYDTFRTVHGTFFT